jgi:hypothetical protein
VLCGLQELVNDVTTLCMRVLRLQGAHVEQLMNADYDMCAAKRSPLICAAAVCISCSLLS